MLVWLKWTELQSRIELIFFFFKKNEFDIVETETNQPAGLEDPVPVLLTYGSPSGTSSGSFLVSERLCLQVGPEQSRRFLAAGGLVGLPGASLKEAEEEEEEVVW